MQELILYMSILTSAHVPSYNGCVDNCCVPKHHHTTSQVIYLRGSGGLELHLKNLKNDPFSIENSEIIDVDAVFRDTVDQSTYQLYIGCGGCAKTDPVVVDALLLNGYEDAEVEPFTQTAYHSVFEKEERKFNTSQLLNCSEHHFTIRLVQLPNCTSNIVWGAVVGIEEKFTFMELIAFPVYILMNHGYVWNELGYTYWIWLFVGAPIILFAFTNGKVVRLERSVEYVYMLAFVGFISAAAEEITHLMYAQYNNPVGYGLYVGLFLVVGFAQGIGILFTYLFWSGFCKHDWNISQSHWALFEILLGFSLLLLLGSGFYIGPLSIVIAGSIRLQNSIVHSSSPTGVVALSSTPPVAFSSKPQRPPLQNNKSNSIVLGFINAHKQRK